MPNSPKRLHWLLLVCAAAMIGLGLWRWAGTARVSEGQGPAESAQTARVPVRHSPAAEDDRLRSERSQPSSPLFSYVQSAEAARLTAALPAPAQTVHYVHVNVAALKGKQSPFWQRPGEGRFDVPLADGRSLVVAVEASEMLGVDRFTSTGRIEGRPGSRVLVAWNEGFLHASIEDPELGNYALRTATRELSQFYRIDPALVGPCGGERRPRFETAPLLRKGGALAEVAPANPVPPSAAAENPQRAEVHVLMLYTQSVLATVEGVARAQALQSAFDLAIAKVNAAFEASLITARVKLVAIAETTYDESRSGSTKVQDDALTALYLEDDGKMDEIHALRDRTGADLVCLALQRADSASSGLSFLLDQPEDPENSRFAFSVVEYSRITGTNVVPHELGHVFGCAHDRQNAASGDGAFSFSYGYRFFGADGRQYHDIMAYPPGTELSYFSNPEVVLPAPINVPIGVPVGRIGESNTALTIERTAFLTATYRLQTQAAVNAGTLINVATRAFVGTGEDVLIGGFVVRGPQPKQMLIRAAGPSLTAFGVTNALVDPVLRVFSGGTVIAENDNWTLPVGTAASAGEVAAAAAQAQAFAFAAGSADSAVLVTLPSGAYTAVIEGARGATGAGLVEAYDVSSGAARIVNLATRAYVGGDDKELVGGFVVQGAAGSTKRILVRVLGPTLSRAPFRLSGTLDDPEMEVRNAAGDLLIKNDDWSSDSEGGISDDNDFRPLVKLYGEKQIFATGLAPTNRREPCVLMDLPPGNFTVIVRPFQFRSPSPALDQPPRPGVGVVEVYEIDR